MHSHASNFVLGVVEKLPPRQSVVEFGSRDINGSMRDRFPPTPSYIGIDIVKGKGVDVVANAMNYVPAHPPDTVVCCEVLEHSRDPYRIIKNAFDILLPDGVFIITAAAPARVPHSGKDGLELAPGEYYANIDPGELKGWLAQAGFHDVRMEMNESHTDVYAVAFK